MEAVEIVEIKHLLALVSCRVVLITDRRTWLECKLAFSVVFVDVTAWLDSINSVSQDSRVVQAFAQAQNCHSNVHVKAGT